VPVEEPSTASTTDIHHAKAQDQQLKSVCSSEEDNPKRLQAVNVLRQRKPSDNECSIAI
jgi:hypothetical protein